MLPLDAAARWGWIGTGGGARAVKILKPLRLIRLAKIMRLMRKAEVFKYIRASIEAIQDKTKIRPSDTVLRLLYLFITFFLLGHYVACIFYLFESSWEFPDGSWSKVSRVKGSYLTACLFTPPPPLACTSAPARLRRTASTRWKYRTSTLRASGKRWGS